MGRISPLSALCERTCSANQAGPFCLNKSTDWRERLAWTPRRSVGGAMAVQAWPPNPDRMQKTPVYDAGAWSRQNGRSGNFGLHNPAEMAEFTGSPQCIASHAFALFVTRLITKITSVTATRSTKIVFFSKPNLTSVTSVIAVTTAFRIASHASHPL